MGEQYLGYLTESGYFMYSAGPIKLPVNRLMNVQVFDENEADRHLHIHDQFIKACLMESEAEASSPRIRTYSHEEVFGRLKKQHAHLFEGEADEDSEDDYKGSLHYLNEYQKEFGDRIKWWQRFDDDWRELFTMKLRENIEFGAALWATLGNISWYHNNDSNNNKCGVPSFRGAASFISSMLGFTVSQMDWLELTDAGIVSAEIASAMAKRGWRCEKQ